jgi:hypothetical protein
VTAGSNCHAITPPADGDGIPIPRDATTVHSPESEEGSPLLRFGIIREEATMYLGGGLLTVVLIIVLLVVLL